MKRRRESKLDPVPIVKAHYRTLVDAATGRRCVRDHIEQVAMPVAVGAGAWWFDMRIAMATGVAILTLAGIFAAFLFQLTIQLLDRASGWADGEPEPGPITSRYAGLLTELSANAAYASLVAAATASVSLGVTISSTGWQQRLLAAMTLGALTHLGTTLLMVTRRVFLLTISRLRDARTGAYHENA